MKKFFVLQNYNEVGKELCGFMASERIFWEIIVYKKNYDSRSKFSAPQTMVGNALLFQEVLSTPKKCIGNCSAKGKVSSSADC